MGAGCTQNVTVVVSCTRNVTVVQACTRNVTAVQLVPKCDSMRGLYPKCDSGAACTQNVTVGAGLYPKCDSGAACTQKVTVGDVTVQGCVGAVPGMVRCPNDGTRPKMTKSLVPENFRAAAPAWPSRSVI